MTLSAKPYLPAVIDLDEDRAGCEVHITGIQPEHWPSIARVLWPPDLYEEDEWDDYAPIVERHLWVDAVVGRDNTIEANSDFIALADVIQEHDADAADMLRERHKRCLTALEEDLTMRILRDELRDAVPFLRQLIAVIEKNELQRGV